MSQLNRNYSDSIIGSLFSFENESDCDYLPYENIGKKIDVIQSDSQMIDDDMETVFLRAFLSRSKDHCFFDTSRNREIGSYPPPTLTYEEIESFASEDADKNLLIKALSSRVLDTISTTLSLEFVGKCSKNEEALKVLITYLSDNRDVVREGAIYGLHNHIEVDMVAKSLISTRKSEKNSFLIDVLSDIGEEIEERRI